MKLEITILESRLLSAISPNELESDTNLLRVKQKESEAAIRHQGDVICALNEETQFLKARLLALETAFLKITYNVSGDNEPGSSVYNARGINKAAASRANEQIKKTNLSSINTEFPNTSYDNNLTSIMTTDNAMPMI